MLIHMTSPKIKKNIFFNCLFLNYMRNVIRYINFQNNASHITLIVICHYYSFKFDIAHIFKASLTII